MTCGRPWLISVLVMTIALTRSFALTTEDGAVLRYQTIGSGEGLIVVGGATLTARHYLPLARILALSATATAA